GRDCAGVLGARWHLPAAALLAAAAVVLAGLAVQAHNAVVTPCGNDRRCLCALAEPYGTHPLRTKIFAAGALAAAMMVLGAGVGTRRKVLGPLRQPSTAS
ncbi:MAG TPA: hypothetical protein VE777_20905, partial [Gaiellales bacterium]|nr:hypothetical protein [Gaiellales bacterium]